MKITIIAGARPNFMKIAPLIHAIKKAQNQGEKLSYRVVYTGIENDSQLEPELFSDLAIERPDTYLGVNETSFVARTAAILTTFEQDLMQNDTDIVFVVDDLTPTMACAMVAKKHHVKVAHLVAGTRSFNINRPKEVNRIIADAMADILFTAGIDANRNLSICGTDDKSIYFVGNVLIDNIRNHQKRTQIPNLYNKLKLKNKDYILLTLNKHSLLEDRETMRRLLRSILQNTGDTPVVAPMHEYAQKAIKDIIGSNTKLHLCAPQRFLDFSFLQQNAKGIITDSGNVAEEATFFGVPCITLDEYTEHPETWKIGSNVLVGTDEKQLKEHLDKVIRNQWKSCSLPPKWDGMTSDRIVKTILNFK